MNKIKTIITTLLGLISSSAFAQSAALTAGNGASLFTPAVNSQAEQFMASMFAGLMDMEGGNPLESLIQSFNAIVLVIAGIIITYQIMNGLIATAHEGQFLGKKLNAATYPLRIAIASAIIVPIKGGYAVVQMVVMWLVIQSIGFADQTWINYVSKTNFEKSMQVRPASPESKQMVRNVFESLVCVKVLNTITNDPQNNFGITSQFGFKTIKDDDNSRRIGFGNFNYTHGFNHEQCGSIDIKRIQGLDSKLGGASGTLDTGVVGSGKDSILVAKIQTAVNLAHRQATDQLISDLDNYSTSIVSSIINGEINSINNITGIDKNLASFSNKYNNFVTKAVTSQLKEDDLYKNIREKANSDGFVSSMFLYNKMAHLADVVGRSVSTEFTYVPAKPISNQLYADQYATNISKLKTLMNSKTNSPVNLATTTTENGVDEDGNLITRLFEEQMSEKLSGGMFQIYPDEHPLMAAKRIGNNILNGLASITLGGLLAGLVASKIVGTGALGVVGTIIQLLWTAGLPLIFFLLVVIPLTPVMYILGSIIGWVVSVVEAVIIAPFWAVMHIVHGDDLLGSGERGYKLLVNILMKPVLIVVGVISSYVLIGVISSFILNSYGEIMNALTVGSTGWLSSFFYGIMSIFIISVISFVIMMSLMKLVFQLPDRIMQWITNSENTLGGSAQDLAGAGSTAAKISTGIAGVAGNTGAKIGGETLKALSDKKMSTTNMSNADKLSKTMSEKGYGGSDSLSNVKASSEVKGISQQLNGLEGGLGEQFASLYNQERGENGSNSDHNTAFSNALTKTFGSNFEAGSPEMNLVGAMASDPKAATMGIQALSKLKQFGESRGMLSNDISNSISGFASNVAKNTNNFKDGNLSEVIGTEYYKSKNGMAGAM